MATGSSTLVEVDSDGGLVLGTLAGDRATFATLYDRFSPTIYDLHLALLRNPTRAAQATFETFQRAVANLNHLGDPRKLRPWLYSLVYRQREPGKGKNAPGPVAGVRPGDPPLPDPQAELWQAASELGRAERALVTLRLRHGLDLEETAGILGLSPRNTEARLNALRGQIEPALRALLSARLGIGRQGPRNRPPNGPPTPASVEELLLNDPTPLRTAIPLATPPAALREQVLTEIPLITAHQGLPRPRTRAAWISTVAIVLTLVVGTSLFVHRNLERKPVIAVTFGPSSELSLSTTVIDLGAVNTTASLTLANTGSNQLAWEAKPADPWLKVDPPAGLLAGGKSQQLTVTANRAALPTEGDGRTQLKVTSGAGQGEGNVSVALREERPPAILNPRASNTRIGGYGCPTVSEISATVRDESTPVRVVLVGPGQQTQAMQPTQPGGQVYSGRLGSGSGANIAWKIIATDARNNTSTSPTSVIQNADCAVRPAPKPSPSASARPEPSRRPSQSPGSSRPSSAPDDDEGSSGGRGPGGSDDGSSGDDDGPAGGSGRFPF